MLIFGLKKRTEMERQMCVETRYFSCARNPPRISTQIRHPCAFFNSTINCSVFICIFCFRCILFAATYANLNIYSSASAPQTSCTGSVQPVQSRPFTSRPVLRCPALPHPVLSCVVQSRPVSFPSNPIRHVPVPSVPVPCIPVRSRQFMASPFRACPLHSCPVHSRPVHSFPIHSWPAQSCPIHAHPFHSCPWGGLFNLGWGPTICRCVIRKRFC